MSQNRELEFASGAARGEHGPSWWAPRLLGVLLVATYARLAIWAQVFVGDAVLPRYPDAYYHLRQIQRAVGDFPRVPVADPLLNWPEGGFSQWPPAFDWMGAALVLALGAGDDPTRAAQVAAFLPVALGLACVAAVIWLARQFAPLGPHRDTTALAAGLVWAILPNAVVASGLGRIDHHVAEVLAMALLGAWVTWAAREPDPRSRGPGAWLVWECSGAIIALWSGLVFSGSVVYVALAVALRGALQLAEPGRAPCRLLGSGALAFGLAGAGLAALSVSAVAVHGHTFDFRFQTFLQPLLYGAAAAASLGTSLLTGVCARETHLVRRLAARVGAAAAALALAALGAWLVAPEPTREVLRGLTQFMARRDPWLARIDEFQPLFRSWALWRWSSWEQAYHIDGIFGLLAPVALAAGCGLALRSSRRLGALFTGWTLAVAGLTLLQLRFGRLLSVNLAISMALALVWLGERVAARWRGAHPAWVWIGVLAVCVGLDPLARARVSWQPAREPSPLESAAFFLGASAASGAAERGVLAPWDWGHTLLALGGQPVVSAGFGPWVGADGFREVEASLAGTETALIELMQRRRLHWLATGRSAFESHVRAAGDHAGPVSRRSGRPDLDIEYFRRVPLAPLILGGSGAPAHGIPHVGHLLPRFASRERDADLTFPLFLLWLYERIPGARIEGIASPGARIVAKTFLRAHDTILPWEAWADADAMGAFRIVVPLPNGMEAPPLSTSTHYEVWNGEARIAQLSVKESDVRQGRTLRATSTPAQPVRPVNQTLSRARASEAGENR